MAVRKQSSGRWHAVLRNGRDYVAGRTFDTRREAEAWLSRERAGLAGGIDPRAGQIAVKKAYASFLTSREHSVATKTPRSDVDLLRIMPPNLANLHVGLINDREVQRTLDTWSRTYAESSVRRYRAVLSGFFA